nr:hypothetical protein [Geomicrobium sp. JCM 19055]
MFDENFYQDKNYIVDLTNTIFLCTANYKSKQEIAKSLSPPMVSRFSDYVKYEPLSSGAKREIVNKRYYHYYDLVSDDDRKIIDARDLLTDLERFVEDNHLDFRGIDNTIKGKISRILLDELLKTTD